MKEPMREGIGEILGSLMAIKRSAFLCGRDHGYCGRRQFVFLRKNHDTGGEKHNTYAEICE